AYYSMDGNTEYIAKRVARTSGGELMKLELEKKPPSKGIRKILWGGRHAMMGAKLPLKELSRDAGEYDVIFIGTPVWAWRVSTPVASFMDKADLSGKKLAFFATCDSNDGSTFEKMREASKGSEVLGQESFMKVLKETPERKAADAVKWTKHIMDTLNAIQ
ncbi:MAG: flavodoxin, partial [Candidatus Thermoplasmatota archaeon]|nr:flavodoxin [Candidatus Thermoplasmatota archaeon]